MKKIFFLLILAFAAQVKAQDQVILDKGVELIHLLDSQQAEKIALYFDSSVHAQLNPSQMNLIWRQLEGQMGQFQDTTGWMMEEHTLYVGLHFEKGDLDIKLMVNDKQLFSGIFFAPAVDKSPYILPDYADTSLFTESDFTLYSGSYRLSGKLCLPKSKKKLPLCILSHGSGPQSMDVHIGPNRMFKDIAYGLASNGVAVFRFHKRTYVYGSQSAKDPNKLSINEEYIEDLLSAIDTFSGIETIDAKRIYLLGHSQGGVLAPEVARLSGKLKGIIMAAAPYTPMDSLILAQMEYLNDLDTSGTYYRPLKDLREEVSFLRSPDFDTTAESSWLPLGLNAWYWTDMLNYHPEKALKEYKGKKLLLFGGEDYQVPPIEAERWKAEGIKKTKIVVIPGCGHSFMPSQGKKGPAQYDFPNHVDRSFILEVLRFLN